ncbi:MAG TPA: PilN domain-containing protein [Phycisphaerae bacterium]|nr:PilN domain-containing protein [Phycisphaerae bacterium]
MINLLPQDYVQRRNQHRVNVFSVILLAVVLASVAGAALVSERSSRNTREVCERINHSYEEASRLIDEMYQLEAQKRTMLDKAKTSAALMERLPRSYVLAILTNALPKGASLTSIKLTTHVVKPPAPTAPAVKAALVANQRAGAGAEAAKLAVSLEVKGKAATDVEVARFIANLAKHPLTDMVDLSYSKEARGKDDAPREFHIRIRLKPNGDALEAVEVEAKLPRDDGPGGDA